MATLDLSREIRGLQNPESVQPDSARAAGAGAAGVGAGAGVGSANPAPARRRSSPDGFSYENTRSRSQDSVSTNSANRGSDPNSLRVLVWSAIRKIHAWGLAGGNGTTIINSDGGTIVIPTFVYLPAIIVLTSPVPVPVLAPVPAIDGRIMFLQIMQDSTGGREFTFSPADFIDPASIPTGLKLFPNERAKWQFFGNGGKWDFISWAQG